MRPPKPRFCLNVGVTGHRLNRLNQAQLVALRPTIESILTEVREQARACRAAHAEVFAASEAQLCLLTALAEGADRMIGQAALDLGYELCAILPFARDVYAQDFAEGGSKMDFAALLDTAARVLELPGQRNDPDAYEQAGDAILAHSDIIVALWDGEASNRPGGTAAVVLEAVRRGLPVIHIGMTPQMQPSLIWLGHDGTPVVNATPALWKRLPADKAAVRDMIAAIVGPPDEADEKSHLELYYQEKEFRFVTRVEYPLMLAAVGVGKVHSSMWRRAPYRETTDLHWAGFKSAQIGLLADNEAALAHLQAAYSWSDNLASHYAQIFRSGHVLNFLFAAFAIMAALLGLLWPHSKFWLVLLELVLIGTVLVNTRHGRARQWHRRWLDYRSLAEHLRPMRGLKLLGAAQLHVINRAGRGMVRWTSWYAQAIWRQFGLPHGRIEDQTLSALDDLLIVEELEPQIAYHHANAHRMELLDHRLHLVGIVFFAATIFVCLLFLFTMLAFHDWAFAHAKMFTIASAILPALGSAVYGIRVHGDFAGHGHRSADTAAHLAAIRSVIVSSDSPKLLPRSVALAEAAAAAMWHDMADWRLTAQQRNLDIPS